MQKHWQKLLTRENVDLTTIADCVTKVMDRLFSDFFRPKQECVFTYFKGGIYTQYVAFDPQEMGYYLFQKYFNSPTKIKKLVVVGQKLIQNFEEKTNFWRKRLTLTSRPALFLKALDDFSKQAEDVSYLYSIGAWFAIEVWQNRFEEILAGMIQRNKLKKEQEKIFASAFRPWRKTAIPEIREKLKNGVNPQKLANDYQYLRSWSAIWYEPIDASWVKKVGEKKETRNDYSRAQLEIILKPNPREKRHLILAPYLVYFKDWRDELRRKFVYHWNFLFQMIAQAYKLPYHNLGYLTINEIKKMVASRKIPLPKIKKRKQNPCVVVAKIGDREMKIIDQKARVKKYLQIRKQIGQMAKANSKKTKWQKVASRQADLTLISSAVLLSFHKLFWEFTKKRGEFFFTIFENKGFTHYISVDPQAFGLFIWKKFFNTQKKILWHYARGKMILKDIQKNTKKWQKILTPDSPLKLFSAAFTDFKKDAQKVHEKYNITSWFAIEAWQNIFEAKLEQMITRNALQDKKEQIYASVFRPWRITPIPSIHAKLEKGVDPRKIVQDYQYLRSWCVIWYKPIDLAWVKDVQIGMRNKKGKVFSQKELIKILKPTAQEKYHLQLAPYLTFLKDWRDELRRKQVYYWNFFFQMITQRLKMEYNDLGYLTNQEIKAALKNGKINQRKIEWRKNNPSIYTIDIAQKKLKVLDQKTAVARYLQIIQKIGKEQKDIEIKGLVAQRGVARGKVALVRTHHDLKRVQIGNILVANATHPNYLPAMQKAAAIVTNEGGMICHAAIVAREMKKPCIVGTKIATQVLKEGDQVEVDAERGVVKIIQN